jgi:DNA-binding CsgD family transcriptional regulator
MSPGTERRIESASATMTRMTRRRSSGYQRVDPDELRQAFTVFTSRFYRAIEGEPDEPLRELLATAVRKRLQQGLHPLEVFGAWTVVRSVLEAATGDRSNAVEVLDRCETAMVEYLREGVSLRPPYSWPVQELEELRRTLDRLTVGLELIGQSTPPVMAPTGGTVTALTRREREILTACAGGLTVDQIAAELGVSRATVRTYISRSTAKLGAVNRTHAIAIAVGLGVVIPPMPATDVAPCERCAGA